MSLGQVLGSIACTTRIGTLLLGGRSLMPCLPRLTCSRCLVVQHLGVVFQDLREVGQALQSGMPHFLDGINGEGSHGWKNARRRFCGRVQLCSRQHGLPEHSTQSDASLSNLVNAQRILSCTLSPAVRAGGKVSLRARVKAFRSTLLQVASDRNVAKFPRRMVVLARIGASSSTCERHPSLNLAHFKCSAPSLDALLALPAAWPGA